MQFRIAELHFCGLPALPGGFAYIAGRAGYMTRGKSTC